MNPWATIGTMVMVAGGAVLLVKSYVDNLEKRYRRWMRRQLAEQERLERQREEQLLREKPWKWQEAWEWQLTEIRTLPEKNHGS